MSKATEDQLSEDLKWPRQSKAAMTKAPVKAPPPNSSASPALATPSITRTNSPTLSTHLLGKFDQVRRAPSFRVLSIDGGGGVRGMIPAAILKEIEQGSGQRISQLFDRICGTSTGAILACALAAPKSTCGNRRED